MLWIVPEYINNRLGDQEYKSKYQATQKRTTRHRSCIYMDICIVVKLSYVDTRIELMLHCIDSTEAKEEMWQ